MLLVSFSSRVARAQPSSSVVILKVELSDAERWDEGTQAVVAELLTTGFALEVRPARAQHSEELRAELEAQLEQAPVSGALAVFRHGERGVAWVHDRRFGLEQVEVDVAGGPLARSRFVLRIVELLRNVSIEAQAAPVASPPQPRVSVAPPARPAPSPAGLRAWLGGGALLAGGITRPLAVLSASAAVGLHPLLGAEASVSFSPGRAAAATAAGEVRVRAEQLAAFISFDPFAKRSLGVALGLGGGVVWTQASAVAQAGFSSKDAATSVALLSARARAFLTWRRFQAVLTVDPGLLLPALDVTADGERALRVGRPWVSVCGGIGVAL